MPKKDPITGCMVITQNEFWAKEAEHERLDRSAGDLMEDFYDELEKDRVSCEAALYDPKQALGSLRAAITEQNRCVDVEDRIPVPTRVLHVIEAHFSQSFQESNTYIKARVKLRRGTAIVEMTSSYSSGSFYEPPDGETEVTLTRE